MSSLPEQHPVQLWSGDPAQLRDEAILYAQQIIAPCKGCRFCHICRALAQRQWPPLVWVSPGPHGHTRELLDEGLAPLTLATDLPHLLVIEQAELLLPATANRLLKPLEEPPPGWHILLLTDRPALLMNTVRSRCIMRTIPSDCAPSGIPAQGQNASAHATIAWLKAPDAATFTDACNGIDTLPKSPAESIQLWEELLSFWHAQWMQRPHERRAKECYLQLVAAGKQLPPSGSSLRFWRLLVVSLKEIIAIFSN